MGPLARPHSACLSACLSPTMLPAFTGLAMLSSGKGAPPQLAQLHEQTLQPQNTTNVSVWVCKCPTCLCSASFLRRRYRPVGNGTNECRILRRICMKKHVSSVRRLPLYRLAPCVCLMFGTLTRTANTTEHGLGTLVVLPLLLLLPRSLATAVTARI